ncbi:MAG: Hpt domain-containing protein [Cyclobacteriaceae bacterium]
MEIDFTYLETVSDGDNDFILQFIKTFEETIQALSEKMQSELDTGDFENLGKSAHQLKPSAKMLGLVSGDHLEELQNNPESANQEILTSIRDDCSAGLQELIEWAKGNGIVYS